MIGPNFMEEIDCGSFFENIDDLLENPGDDEIDAGGLNFVEDNSFPPIWATGSDSLPGSDSVFSGNRDSDLSAELAVPYEDIVQLEWLSNFVEDSGGSNLTMIDNTIKKGEFTASRNASAAADANPFRTSSPVSVLESSSSCSSDKTVPHSPKQDSTAVAETAVPTKRGRPRSKRSRPPAFSPRPPIQLTGEGNSIRTVGSDSSSRLVIKIPRQALSEHKKKKKTNRAATAAAAAAVAEEGKENYQGTTSLGVRKCFHCEVTKTPQWRAGPMGPKTLCNACGVRYKSGRLFPEYRPAASPTFVPSVHSNSHKKVLEMRNHTKEETEGPETAFGDCGVLIPNQNSNLDMDYL